VPAAPNKEHNRPPQQPTRKAGQDQFRIVCFCNMPLCCTRLVDLRS
jgi:hypothetical protein